MNCKRARTWLALDVGGDLARKNSQLAAHLAGCAACRRVARDLGEDRSRLRSLRDHVAPPEVFHRLRPVLVERLGGPEGELGWLLRLERALRTGGRPRYALAGLAILLAVSLSVPFVSHGVRSTEEPVRIAAAPPPPPPESLFPDEWPMEPAIVDIEVPVPSGTAQPQIASVADPVTDVVSVTVEGLVPFEPPNLDVLDLAALTAGEARPDTLLMKLTTDDPDIVIYWLAGDDAAANTASTEGGV